MESGTFTAGTPGATRAAGMTRSTPRRLNAPMIATLRRTYQGYAKNEPKDPECVPLKPTTPWRPSREIDNL